MKMLCPKACPYRKQFSYQYAAHSNRQPNMNACFNHQKNLNFQNLINRMFPVEFSILWTWLTIPCWLPSLLIHIHRSNSWTCIREKQTQVSLPWRRFSTQPGHWPLVKLAENCVWFDCTGDDNNISEKRCQCEMLQTLQRGLCLRFFSPKIFRYNRIRYTRMSADSITLDWAAKYGEIF